MSMARTILTKWHRGGMTEPTNTQPSFKAWKSNFRVIRESLQLSPGFSGTIAFYIKDGGVIRADIQTV